MDVSKLNVGKAASMGVEVHLKDPTTGKPLYDDEEKKKPCTVTVYGVDSKQYREAEAEVRKDWSSLKKKVPTDFDIVADNDKARLRADFLREVMSKTIKSVGNLEIGDSKATPDDIAELIKDEDYDATFFLQINQMQQDRRYLSDNLKALDDAKKN